MAVYSGLLDRTPAPAGESAGSGWKAGYFDPATMNQASTQIGFNNIAARNQPAASNLFGQQTPNNAVSQAINGINLNGGQPSIFSGTKNASVQGGVGGLMDSFNANRAATNQSIADYTKNYLSSKPQADAASNQEINSIGQWYGTGAGSVQNDLNNLMAQRNAATRNVLQQAQAQAARDNSMRRLQTGNSSYNDALYASALGGLAANEAANRSNLALQNYQYLRNGQATNLGARNNIINQSLNRDLMPVQAGQQLLGNDSGLLGGISNLDNANNFYQFQTPQDMAARQIGLLGGIQGLQANQANLPLDLALKNTGLLSNQLSLAQQQSAAPIEQGMRQLSYNNALQASPIDQQLRQVGLSDSLLNLGNKQTMLPIQQQGAQLGLNNAQLDYQNRLATNPLQRTSADLGLLGNILNQNFQNQNLMQRNQFPYATYNGYPNQYLGQTGFNPDFQNQNLAQLQQQLAYAGLLGT